MTEAAFRLSDIVQVFPGVRALDGANLLVKPGEVHGLVGENGAGKSTIIKVLAGVYQPAEGRVEVGGQELSPATPEAVHAAGVRFIHQELHLVPHFTVTESVFMGQEISSPFGLMKSKMRQQAEAFMRDQLGSELPGNRLIRDLSPAERKLVQVARALIDGAAKVVVFDEPTAPLASDEVLKIMTAIEQLKKRGIAILYVSHYLNEITDICDRVTVFRQGKDVKVFDEVNSGTGSELVSAMIGRELDAFFPTSERQAGDDALCIEGFGDGQNFDDVTLNIRRGEIFGIAGLIGSGREELIDALYGLRKLTTGTLKLDGQVLDNRTAAGAVANGMVLVPRDRRHDGLVLPMTVEENATLATLDEAASLSLINRGQTKQVTEGLIADLDIRPANAQAVTRFLSGGNQQKVVLARWLAKSAKVFIFDDPTVGVDVGAKSEIYQLIENLAADGGIILISSSDPVELVGTCDRVAVMMRGAVRTIIEKDDLNVDHLVAVTTGATEASEADNAG
jgi:ribose transport system ATP-binding protein